MKSSGRRHARSRLAKSSASGTAQATEAVPAGSSAAQPRTEGDSTLKPRDRSDLWFILLSLGILLVAAALRLPQLALNPFHNDEGVNGFFLTNLVRQGIYHYDPANYHGPSLYYFAFVSEILFGLTTEAMRLVPVVFGLMLVALPLALRRYIGSVAALIASLLLAISPGAVYVSRYFIHETLLVAFSMALFVSVVFYLDRREPKHLLVAAAAAALLVTTKETGIITVVVLLIAVVVAHYYVRMRSPSAARRRPGRTTPVPPPVWIEGVEYRPARSRADTGRGMAQGLSWIPRAHIAGAAVVFLVIYLLLFSSFFTNYPKGLMDSLATFTIWTQTGGATQTQPFERYLTWMIPTEAPILILGFVGGLIAAIRGRHLIWVVTGLWAVGITTVYSIIQYKTPWIILNMLLPLALLAGLAVSEAWRSWRTGPLRFATPVVLAAACAFSGYQAIDLNFRHYDDETYPYVFVHSTRQMLSLVDEIEATATRAGTGKDTGIVIVSSDYWPLPWYLRDYPRAGFFGSIVETTEAMIVANVNQEAELEPAISGRYDRVGVYTLRPGVDLVLYVRSDIPKG